MSVRPCASSQSGQRVRPSGSALGRLLILADQLVELEADRLDMRRQRAEQGSAVRQPMQLSDIVHRFGGFRQFMRLPVVDHLQAMLDRAQHHIGLVQPRRDLRRDDARCRPAACSASRVAPCRSAGSRPPWISWCACA